jgi:hypothetical protein
MKRLYSLYRWLPVLLAVVWVPAARAVHSATQSSSYFYDAPGTYTVTNVLTYSSETLTYFMWVPTVPVGWTVSNARGDGQPELMDYGSYYTIGFNAPSFKSPITFYYDVTIPSGTTGDQPVIGDFWFNKYGANDSEKAMPNPLILRQPRSISGYVFHEVDNNGIYDTWDQPATNISVLLLEGGTTNRVAAPVVTDASGYYAFGGLPDGSYDVLYWVKTNQVTVAPGGSNTNRNQLVPNSDMIIPVSITTATNLHVNVGMTGTSPLSSRIDLRAYKGAEGVFVEFVAYDVAADGEITLFLLDGNGNPVWIGTASVRAGPRQVVRFEVPGLMVGNTYDFAVRDEIGQPWRADDVPVTPFAAEMIRMSLAGVTLAFDSLPDREYEIQWTPRLGQSWRTITNVWSQGERTSLVVPHPDPAAPSGFFRIRVK